VLVPYPYAWRYQQVNAEYLARQGAAQVVADADLASRLLPAVQELMRDRDRREKMRQAMQSLAKPDAAQSIASLLFDMAGRGYRS
jgi:UDP-N-acetylglucosamine--N-acetylmuramyl-(pentapeptide) pyrophosphoryl-undecaprenol N-acetylglucosamine transferase